MSTSRGLPSVLRNLWAFHIAAEEQQFQLAAARLNIAQSAVSRRIRQLEDDLGVKLFERRASGVQLTPEGEIFRADVVRILNGIDESVARVRRASKGVAWGLITTKSASQPGSRLPTWPLKSSALAAPAVCCHQRCSGARLMPGRPTFCRATV